MLLNDSAKASDLKAGQFYRALEYTYDTSVLCLRGIVPDDGGINQIGYLELKTNLHILTPAEEEELFAAIEE
jgi:hypothetical protein